MMKLSIIWTNNDIVDFSRRFTLVYLDPSTK